MSSLVELKEGESASVVSIEGSPGLETKLGNMGLRQGVVVQKVARVFRRGPIVIKIGSFQIALGRGMASKVKVKPI